MWLSVSLARFDADTSFAQVAEYSDNFNTNPYAGRWVNEIKGATWDSVNFDLDIVDDNDVAIRYTSSPGSIDHEAQVTARANTSTRLVGPGVRWDNAGVDNGYGMTIENGGVIIQRYNNGARTNVQSFAIPVTFTGGNFYTMRLAASGGVGGNVTLNIWVVDHGPTKPGDPGWIGNDSSPQITFTDSSATRIAGLTNDNGAIAGRASISTFDGQHDYFKLRAISARGGSTPPPSSPPPPSDTTPPSVSITSPASSATVSGTTSITANASDNVGVAGVEFRVDTVSIGPEDTTSPYSISWNTTSVSNGFHTITAIARDTSGNTVTSANIVVNVSNSSAPPPPPPPPPSVGTANNPDGLPETSTVLYSRDYETQVASDVLSQPGLVRMEWGANYGYGPSGGWRAIPEPCATCTDNEDSAGWAPVETAPFAGGNHNFTVFSFMLKMPATLLNAIDNTSGGFWAHRNKTLDFKYRTSTGAEGNRNGIHFGENPPRWTILAGGAGPDVVDSQDWRPYADQWVWMAFVVDMRSSNPADRCISIYYRPEGATNVSRAARGCESQGLNPYPGYGFYGLFSPLFGYWDDMVGGSALGSSLSQMYVALDRLRITPGWPTDIPPASSAPPSPSDTTPPTVSISTPSSGSTVSGSSVTVSANASDNTGVVGVQFRLDGANLGAEDTTAPYSIVWNTTSATNGTHNLTAVARDAAGNLATSPIVSVTVSNTTTPTPSGLIFFDNFEYPVSKFDSAATKASAFTSAGWTDLKDETTRPGGASGYLSTVTSIPGYTGAFPGTGSRALLMEGLPTTMGDFSGGPGTYRNQTDFYLQLGGGASAAYDDYIPGDVWFQFWVYPQYYGSQLSRFAARNKFLYPCNGSYGCHSHLWIAHSAARADRPLMDPWPFGNPSQGDVLFGLTESAGLSNIEYTGPNYDPYSTGNIGQQTLSEWPRENRWTLVKMHFNTTRTSGNSWEMWLRPMGGSWTKVAEWIGGVTPGFVWDIPSGSEGGHRVLRMPSTWGTANFSDNTNYDAWLYMDDFAMATSESALPTYGSTPLPPPPPPTQIVPPTRFTTGSRIQTNATVNVRSTAAGTSLGTQPSGATGTVTGGPTYASLSGTNYWWWGINFDTSFDGWVADDFLNPYTDPAPPPPPSPTPAPTVSLSANPTSITQGGSSTLTWSSTNATSCTASNGWSGTKSTSGTQSVTPTTNTTYILTCTGSGGSASANTSITVTTVPTPTPPAPTPPAPTPPAPTPSGLLLFDNFEYPVGKFDSGATKASAFTSAGWTGLKDETTRPGGAGGYLYTVTNIPGTTSPFPSGGSRALAIEGLSATLNGQTDFYLQMGGDGTEFENYIPSNVWFQFWVYINKNQFQNSGFTGGKFIYPCNRSYPCPGTGQYHNWLFVLDNPAPESYDTGSAFMKNLGTGADILTEPDWDQWKLYQQNRNEFITPNRWQLVKLHMDTSDGTGKYEAWIRPLGQDWVKVAEWIHGVTPNFNWILPPEQVSRGHRILRMPTTWGEFVDSRLYRNRDTWMYMDDFAMATSESALPTYNNSGGQTSPPPPSPTPAPTVSLSANPTSVTSGNSSTLTWSSTNATSCTASNGWSGTKSTSGTQSVTPTANTTYTLTCTGSGGNSNTSTSVTVASAPPITAAPTVSNFSVQVRQGEARFRWNTDRPATSQVEYGATTAYGTQSAVSTILRTSHEVVVSGFNSGSYNARARSVANNLTGLSNNTTFTVRSRPPRINLVTASPGSIILNWSPISFTGYSGVAILRSTTGYLNQYDANFEVARVTGSSFTDTSVTPGTVYYYSLFVYDDQENYSDPATVSFTAPESINPPTPIPTPQDPPVSSGGGGRGGGGGGSPVSIPSSIGVLPSNFNSLPEAQQISILTAKILELQTLINFLISQGAGLPSGTCSFTRDLTLGSSGEDVRCLQKYLNSQGFTVSSSGLGSVGNESTYFGPATQSAVIRWQRAKAILPSSGYFGPKSRSAYSTGQ